MTLIIRKAHASDAAAIADIHSRSWNATYSGIIPQNFIITINAERLSMWENALSADHNTYLAVSNNLPAGFLHMFSPSRDHDMKEAGEIASLYLCPECRGRGIGLRLLDFAETTLRELGHKTVGLWVLEKNRRARHVYEKYGFISDGSTRQLSPGLGVMEIRYRLTLNNR